MCGLSNMFGVADVAVKWYAQFPSNEPRRRLLLSFISHQHPCADCNKSTVAHIQERVRANMANTRTINNRMLTARMSSTNSGMKCTQLAVMNMQCLVSYESDTQRPEFGRPFTIRFHVSHSSTYDC